MHDGNTNANKSLTLLRKDLSYTKAKVESCDLKLPIPLTTSQVNKENIVPILIFWY